jgi:hypothetical protein
MRRPWAWRHASGETTGGVDAASDETTVVVRTRER